MDAPQRRNLCTHSEDFTISNCVFNFNYLASVVSEILGGPKFTLEGPVPPCTLPSGIFFVPEANTVLCLMAFLISTFQLFYFSRYQGGLKFTLGGPMPPARPRSGEIFVLKASTSQYLIVFFSLTFYLQQFPIFQGVRNLRQGVLCPLYAPSGKCFCTRGEYFTMSCGVFNFNFLALLLSDILGKS